jgi:hypothetical protein
LEEVFHETHSVWKIRWDENKGTVTPKTMREEALKLIDRYPNKKLIIHFMQPHHPFIGSKDETGSKSAWNPTNPKDTGKTPWEMMEKGEICKERVWSAYKKNLEVVFEDVEKLIKEVRGKTVVSSDHGNLIGEKVFGLIKDYGHTPGALVKQNTHVPWDVIKNKERKEIKKGSTENKQGKDDDIKGKLHDLGYM